MDSVYLENFTAICIGVFLFSCFLSAQTYTPPFEPSERLRAYMDKVEEESGRRISFARQDSLGISGMKIAFALHATDIRVDYSSDLEWDSPSIEQSMAHEITHGLLIYARGYCKVRTTSSAAQEEVENLSILMSMIDDIAVNKLISEEGFAAFSPVYLGVVRRETETALAGQDYYQQFAHNPSYKSKFMVFRYISAWAFLQYFESDAETTNILESFLHAFEHAYPAEFEMAMEVKQVIEEYNIFEADGHERIVRELLALWELNHVTVLECPTSLAG
jgi:hypothetical protein